MRSLRSTMKVSLLSIELLALVAVASLQQGAASAFVVTPSSRQYHMAAIKKGRSSNLLVPKAVALDFDTKIASAEAPPPTKEELFVKWMSSDSLKEVPHPGNKLEVQGSIPSYVQGAYVKNGPGAFSNADGSRRYKHAFDGLAKLQKFAIDGNDVTFTTRFIDSKVKRKMLDPENSQMLAHVSTGPVEPPFPIWDVLLGSLWFDNTVVNFEELSSTGTFCAVTDADIKTEIDITTLDTVGRMPVSNVRGALPGLTQFSTAHSKVAKRDGLTYNYYLELSGLVPLVGHNYAHIVRTNPDLSQTSIGKVPLGPDRSSYVHEISVTDNYAVLVLHPLFSSLQAAVTKGALLPNLKFDPNDTTKIHLFHLDGSDKHPIQTFEGPPCWAYHHVNAFEEVADDGSTKKVTVDIVAYEDGTMTNGPHGYLYMDNMKTEERRLKQSKEGSVWRFTMDLDDSSGATIEPEKKIIYNQETGLPQSLELTSVAPEYQGKPYRYVYGFTGFYQGKDGYMDWAIVKQDVTADSNDMHHGDDMYWREEFMYPGEVSFVPNPDSNKEDGGVLLSTVYDSQRDENFLLVVDAASMKELARAYTGVGFPQSFHGKFYADRK